MIISLLLSSSLLSLYIIIIIIIPKSILVPSNTTTKEINATLELAQSRDPCLQSRPTPVKASEAPQGRNNSKDEYHGYGPNGESRSIKQLITVLTNNNQPPNPKPTHEQANHQPPQPTHSRHEVPVPAYRTRTDYRQSQPYESRQTRDHNDYLEGQIKWHLDSARRLMDMRFRKYWETYCHI